MNWIKNKISDLIPDWVKDKLRSLHPDNMSEETADKITSTPVVFAVIFVILVVSLAIFG